MWSRSTKQRRAAMRRRHTGTILRDIMEVRARRGLVGPMSRWTAARIVEIQAEVNAINRSIQRSIERGTGLLTINAPPKETK